jgi:hypothetical protein
LLRQFSFLSLIGVFEFAAAAEMHRLSGLCLFLALCFNGSTADVKKLTKVRNIARNNPPSSGNSAQLHP